MSPLMDFPRRTTRRGTAHVELLVLVGVILTLGLAAMTTIGKARDTHARKQADCIKSAEGRGGGRGGAGGTAAGDDGEVFNRLLTKIQSGQPLSAAEGAELEGLAAKSDQGLAVSAGVAVSATGPAGRPATRTVGAVEYGPKPKDARKKEPLGPNGSFDAKTKLPSGVEAKGGAYVKATLDTLTPEQQRAIGARMALGATALPEDEGERVKSGQAPVDRLP